MLIPKITASSFVSLPLSPCCQNKAQGQMIKRIKKAKLGSSNREKTRVSLFSSETLSGVYAGIIREFLFGALLGKGLFWELFILFGFFGKFQSKTYFYFLFSFLQGCFWSLAQWRSPLPTLEVSPYRVELSLPLGY